MKKQQNKIWQQIYGASFAIAEYEPWDKITEKDILFFTSKDEKQVCFFKIWGYSYEYCGISCYFSLEDFLSAHFFEVNSNKKNEPTLYMQNAVIGFWDDKNNVSDKNKKRLEELKIEFTEDGSWLHFEMYEERLFPRDLTDQEAELLADALGNLYMMIKSIFKDNLQIDFKNGDALMRKYAGNGTWHNIPIPWEYFEEEIDLRAIVGNNSIIRDIKKIPASNLTIELDARCLPSPMYDEDNDIDFFPVLVTAVDTKNGFVFATEIVEHNKDIANEILQTIVEICFNSEKPKCIKINDKRIHHIIEDFCKRTGIDVAIQKKKLTKTEAAIKSLFEYLNNEEVLENYDEEYGDDDLYFVDEIDYDKYDDKYWTSDSYLLSVSLYAGCYRHLKISGCATLEELHKAILSAFDFDDDHAHAFFLNNKKWTPGGYYSRYIEDEDRYTCNFTVDKVLKDKQQFIYVFDFGEEWTFKCKVLKIINEPTFEPEIVRSKGDAPFQYSSFDDEDEDE